ncbi:MAG: hypothetical protein ABI818_01635 [Acidobacteriota bacterium]
MHHAPWRLADAVGHGETEVWRVFLVEVSDDTAAFADYLQSRRVLAFDAKNTELGGGQAVASWSRIAPG